MTPLLGLLAASMVGMDRDYQRHAIDTEELDRKYPAPVVPFNIPEPKKKKKPYGTKKLTKRQRLANQSTAPTSTNQEPT